MPSLVPQEAEGLPTEGEEFDYYRDMAREICRRARNRAHVSDDEILVLSVVASQIALARYIEPDNLSEQEALTEILSVLDNRDVIHALRSKMTSLLTGKMPRARVNAPSGAELSVLASCADPDEPAGP